MAFVDVDGTARGTHSIASGDADFVYITNTTATATSYDRECWLETGSVTVTSVSGQRVQGTFSGQGECLTSGGASKPFEVSGGQFDVPILD